MSINRGDQLLAVLRTCLLTVPGLPAQRRWQNTTAAVDPTAACVEDGLITLDTERREVGPGAWGRTEVLYKVSVRTPLNTDAHQAHAIAVAITDTFAAATLAVDGNAITVGDTRSGPALPEPEWLHVPVYVSLSYDHP